MDIESFTEFKTGTLEPIVTEAGNKNWAFIPGRLPGRFEMTERLLSVVTEAHTALGSLEQIKGILPDPFLLLTPLQQREAIVSSRLEGTYALPEEMLLFDAEQAEDASVRIPASQQRNERLEVWNHYEALRQGHNWIAESKPLDQSLILHLHKILMTGVRGKDNNPGAFRTRHVAVGHRPRRYIPPPPDRIEPCIAELVAYMGEDSKGSGLVKSYQVHYQFEAIHPFEDGNGRVGRVLLSLCVSKWLRQSMPWLYMSEFFEKHRRAYVERLFNISTNGEWAEWIEYCMHGTVEQSQASIRRCERLRQLRDQYNQDLLNIGSRMRAIIDMLFKRPVIRIAQIAKECDVSKEAARLDIKKLVAIGVLTELTGKRPKAFACFPIIKAAYGDELGDEPNGDRTITL